MSTVTIPSRAEVRDQFRERAVVFLDETYGDEPFRIVDAGLRFADEIDLDLDDIRQRPAAVEVARAVQWVVKNATLNGTPRYLWIGGAYQRTTAVDIDTLTRLDNQTQATISGFIRRSSMLQRLKAAKSGETVSDLARRRRDLIDELERTLV